jgi:type VI secretion system secreted protein VgrG
VDGHILILNDTSVSDHFHYNEASKKVIYNPDQLHPGTLHEWSTNIYSGTTSFSLSDYDYTSPKSLMQTEPLSPPSKFARYEGTGGYYSDKENPVKYGAYYAKLRLEEQTCRQSIQKGMGDLLVIGAGFTFTPIGPMGEKEYLTISMTLTVTAAKWSSENQPREFKEVVCDLEAIPKEVSFRPTRITPKPLITGIQSAMVVGPAGQDPKTPYCSPLGSIKVQFPWDRYNQNGIDQEGQLTSSNWVRVSQISAGNGWGSMFIPRVGNEVLVAFENGDPDKPVVIGNVYNGYNQPPVPPSSNSVLCYISDDSGNYIVWSPISGQESLVLYSPNGDTTHSIGYSTS